MNFEDIFNDTFHESLRAIDGPFWCTDKFSHYTNLQGMIGIIESQELWLSDHRFLNDTEEISYGKTLTTNAILGIANSESNKEFGLFLKSIVEKINQSKTCASYICSMSLAIDALDQWKWYGGSTDGVCMVFSGKQNIWNKGNSHPTHIRQRKIIYNKQAQLAVIEKFIDIYRLKFNEFKRFQHPFLTDLAWLIEEQFIGFKDQQYESEQEVRLTIENLDHILSVREVNHRVAKGIVVPYIATSYISKDSSFKPSPLPLVEIIVSPLARAETALSIQAYLKNKGMESINVSLSKVKFRG
jgi:hypothetical protein